MQFSSSFVVKTLKLLINTIPALFLLAPLKTLCAISLIVWHPMIGEDFATSGSFISKIACDDGTYTSFSLDTAGDSGLFDIQNTNELIVKSGSNLTAGSYSLKLLVTNGSLTYARTLTIEVLADKYQPRVEGKTGYFTLILTTTGELYGIGHNGFGQLGLGHNTHQTTLQLLNAANYGNKRILDMDATHLLTVMLTEDGTVYTWGQKAGYALGDSSDYYTPTAIPASSFSNKYIVKIDSGLHCAAYLAEDGTVFTTSDLTTYRGVSSGSANANAPTAVDTSGVLSGKFITEIQCVGRQSVMMLSSDYLLFGFGINSFGELGQNNTTSTDTPIALTFPGVNDPVRIRQKMTRGIFVIDSAGDLYYAGRNANGQAGLGSTSDITVFTKINASDYGNSTIRWITGSLTENIMFMTSGAIYGAGSNNNKQLALDSADISNRTTFEQAAVSQFSGKTPSFASTTGSGMRVIFTDGYHGGIGYNQHGMLGIGTTTTPIQTFTIIGDTGNSEFNFGTHSAITAPQYWDEAGQNISNFALQWSSYELEQTALL